MNTYQTRYLPLYHWLAQRPPAQQTLRLSFAAIETLIGQPLPKRAQQSRYWSSRGVARTLRPLGWQAWLDQSAAVLFMRLPTTPLV